MRLCEIKIWFYDYARCSSMHALYYKYVNMIICTYITFIVFMSGNSLLAKVYFTLYPTLNKILLTYLIYSIWYSAKYIKIMLQGALQSYAGGKM